MKWLITEGLGANKYIRKTIGNALRVLGHEVYYFDETNTPIFDAFKIAEPDVFWGNTWNLSRATIKNLVARPNLRVLLNANHFGEFQQKPEFAIDYAGENEQNNVKSLLDSGGRLDFITCQYHQDYVDSTHGYWKQFAPIVGQLLSADVTEFKPTLPEEDCRSDIFFLGGYWKYKSKYLQEYLVRFMYPNTHLKFKIFGNGWSLPQTFGLLPDGYSNKFFASAVVSPNLFEPHSVEYGFDINARAYQIPASLGFTISQPAESLSKHVFTEDEIVYTDSPNDFIEKVRHYQQHPEERIPYIEKSALTVMKSHTNIHRAARFLKYLGFEAEEKHAIQLAEENFLTFQRELPEKIAAIGRFFG